MQEGVASARHLTTLCQSVLWSQIAERFRPIRLHQLVVVTFVHRIGVQGAPEAFINLLNLLGKALSWILTFSSLRRYRACIDATAHL